ncbi:MAG: competence/damage-inducible protein CinA C-terminal domain [Rickettsiales bacterium]|jgi:PncC family amidohydrolase|nr:competence/damage-inducible protein CinA C-terminal domain [Rickettsiales bacterium]
MPGWTQKDAAFAEEVLILARDKGVTLATAESCTGGLIGALLTAIPGSSDVFHGGVISYSNQLKTSLLGVSEELIMCESAVSAAVAKAMAEGAVARLKTDYAVAVTGISGPGGGSAVKPVGLVYIAVAGRGATITEEHRFQGDRDAVRLKTAEAALTLIKQALSA